ncbi:MAG: hypothetical protein ACAH80_12900, partial [Alphaproteobacteria bacterium]
MWFKTVVNPHDDFSGQEGAKYYVISTPGIYLGEGSAGRLCIYQTDTPQDKLLYTFNWFDAPGNVMGGKLSDSVSGISYVRLGAQKQPFAASDMLLELYLDGKILKKYAVEDILKDQKDIFFSTSHYRVFWNVTGYKWIDAKNGQEGRYVYELRL